MSLRFRRSLKLAPGIRVNLGLRGPSLSVGPRGVGVTVGPAGVTSHVGVPGSGLSYRHTVSAPAHGTAVARSALPASAQNIGGDNYSVHLNFNLDEHGRLTMTTLEGAPLDARLERHLREERHGELEHWLGQQCDEVNAQVEDVTRAHLTTPAPDQAHHYDAPAFAERQPEAPEDLRLSFLDKIFASRRRRREEAHEQEVAAYDTAMAQWHARRAAQLQDCERQRQRFEDERLTSAVVMHDLLEAALHRVHWPCETSVSFAIEDEGRRVHVDVGVAALEHMPHRTAERAARGLKLNFHELTQAQLRAQYVTHLHAVVFRVVGEVFAELPKVQQVVCSCFIAGPDPATGHDATRYLLSVRVPRTQWQGIDFTQLAAIDPVASLSRFDRRIARSGGDVLDPITPLDFEG